LFNNNNNNKKKKKKNNNNNKNSDIHAALIDLPKKNQSSHYHREFPKVS